MKQHKVYKLSIDGKFSQYLKLSEARLINQIFKEGRKIELTCVMISEHEYKFWFG